MKRLVPVLLIAACSGTPTPATETSTGGRTSAGSSTSSSASSTTSTTSGPLTVTTSTSNSTSDEESTDRSFITDPDGGPAYIECSIFEQDCPRGEKCNAWSNNGGNAWNATKCVPVAPDPAAVREPCTIEGSGLSGLDSCDVGSICWDYDVRTGEGSCRPYCLGEPPTLSCADPNHACIVGGKAAVLSLCFPQCSPLDPEACDVGLGCYLIANGFFCAPDASDEGGAAWDGCEFPNACDPGLLCLVANLVGACPEGAAQCCTPWCDLSAPVCLEPTTCMPFFEEGNVTPGYEAVGVCGSEPS